jgi:hypothetical protein|tara:strand:+ start:1801 stop:2064 length:264 start_codon:yes stop_codon:yes gene_type:complete
MRVDVNYYVMLRKNRKGKHGVWNVTENGKHIDSFTKVSNAKRVGKRYAQEYLSSHYSVPLQLPPEPGETRQEAQNVMIFPSNGRAEK